MRKKRYQLGSIQRRRHGRRWVWVGLWWEGRHRRSKVLGRCSEMTKSEASAAMASILQAINSGLSTVAGEVQTLQAYFERTFWPLYERTRKASSASTFRQRICSLILPHWGKRLMSTISRAELQDWLDRIAPNQSVSIIRHLRWDLSAIFGLARGDGLIQVNPTEGLYVTERLCKKIEKRPPLSAADVLRYLDALEIRERLMARLAIFEGLRPGEIFALRWDDLDKDRLLVRRRIYQGRIDTPKTDRTRSCALSQGTANLLGTWRQESTECSDWVFPSETLETPLRPDNVWKARMRDELRKLGLDWANWQVLRRTNATLMKKAGVDAKVGADQRGHGVGVSLEVYTRSDHEQLKRAVDELEKAVMKGRKKGAGGANRSKRSKAG